MGKSDKFDTPQDLVERCKDPATRGRAEIQRLSGGRLTFISILMQRLPASG